MAVGDRRNVVVEFDVALSALDSATREALEKLRQTVGLVSSLVVVTLVAEQSGLSVAGASGAGTTLDATRCNLDLEDARIDQVRLTGYGSGTAADHKVQLWHGSTMLCETVIPQTSDAQFSTPWTLVELPAGDLAFHARIVGNGIATQTLHRLDLHARTLRVALR